MNNPTEVSSQVTIDNVKHSTVFQLDWTNVSEDDLQSLAQKSVIIAVQNAHRIAKEIPSSVTKVNVLDYCGKRTRAAMTPERALSMLTDEQLTALLKSRGM